MIYLKKLFILLLLTCFAHISISQVIMTEDFNSGGATWHPILQQNQPSAWMVGTSLFGFNFDTTPFAYAYAETFLSGLHTDVQKVTPVNCAPHNSNKIIYMAFDYKVKTGINHYSYAGINYMTQFDTVWASTTDTMGRDTVDISLLAGNPITIFFHMSCFDCLDQTDYFAVDNVVVFASDIPLNTNNPNEQNNNFTIYPNPTVSDITVNFNPVKDNKSSIEVYNNLGKLIAKRIIKQDNNTVNIDLSSFPSGVYFVKSIYKQSVLTKKIIKN